MNRRDFISQAAIAGGVLAASGVTSVARAGTSSVPPDWILVDGSENSFAKTELLHELKTVGVSCCTYNPVSHNEDALGYASDLLVFLDEHPNEAILARSVKDIRLAKRSGKVAWVVGWQSSDPVAGSVGNSGGWETNPTQTYLRAYYELGLRICGIAYNLTNRFGGGCLDPAVPLTRTGRLLVEEIHRLGMLLDVGGHTGEQTSLDAIALAPGVPVVCTHTNVARLVDNPRNVSDRVIDAIASTGGVVGISAVNDFNARSRRDASARVTPVVDLEQMLDHCDYVRKRVGIEHVGLGPDFTQGSGAFKLYPRTMRLFPPEMASEQGPINYVKNFQNISMLPNVIGALRKRGWPEADVRKILGENWLRVYERAWGG